MQACCAGHRKGCRQLCGGMQLAQAGLPVCAQHPNWPPPASRALAPTSLVSLPALPPFQAQVLENVSVAVDLAEAEEFEEEATLPLAVMPQDGAGQT